jgi:hypothetical protein
MIVRRAWALVLLVGLAGCVVTAIDVAAVCLEKYPGQVGCCGVPGDHVSNGTCCAPGHHAVSDVEHEDWRICVWDEDPCADGGVDGGACLDVDAAAP